MLHTFRCVLSGLALLPFLYLTIFRKSLWRLIPHGLHSLKELKNRLSHDAAGES